MMGVSVAAVYPTLDTTSMTVRNSGDAGGVSTEIIGLPWRRIFCESALEFGVVLFVGNRQLACGGTFRCISERFERFEEFACVV